ncbi:MAG: type VI secretion system tube protein Hcp, partial [Actinomycetota bacterium]|nr:type VI secretion system tube protein Hcp [Actinomycetota bacterium]
GPAGPAGPAATTTISTSPVVGTFSFQPSGGTTQASVTVDLYSLDAGQSSSASYVVGTGAGAGVGKSSFDPMVMTIPLGPAAIDLTQSVDSGSQIATGTVILYAANSKTKVEEIDLSNVAVSSLTTSSDASTSGPLVSVSLKYAAIKYVLPTGETAQWSQATNTATFP